MLSPASRLSGFMNDICIIAPLTGPIYKHYLALLQGEMSYIFYHNLDD
jgi:hypothetical protein